MTLLDERLKAAQPVAPVLPEGFAARVMDAIHAQGLRIRPAPRRWRFGALAAAVAAVLAAAVLTNAVVYEVRSNGSLELLEFGSQFLGSVFERIPYDLLAAALALAGTAVLLIRRGRILQTRVAWLLLLTYGASGLGGLALAGSGLNEELQTDVYAERLSWPGVVWFYRERAHFRPPPAHFRFGVVQAVDSGTAQLLSPTGDEVTVKLPPGFQVRVGDHVRLSGAATNGEFTADQAQHCQPGRGQRYFMHRMGAGMGRGPGGGPGPGMMRGRPFDADPGPGQETMPRGPRGPGGPNEQGPRGPAGPGMGGPMGRGAMNPDGTPGPRGPMGR
jgi:hypothetical protein